MRVVVFGIGAFFINQKDILLNEEIIGYIDNDESKWNKEINNICITSPYYINKLSYDKIIIMSRQSSEIKKQLVTHFGIDENLILNFEEYCQNTTKNKMACKLEVHYKSDHYYLSNSKIRILIITYALNYNGGSLAAFYAALALKSKGFDVAIAARKSDKRLNEEITNEGVTIFIQELIDYCSWEQVSWIEQFDYVIVNTLQLGRILKELIYKKPVLWWIHESKIEYEYLDKDIIEYLDNINIEPYVVSDVALHTFRQYFHKVNASILHYGIPDNGFRSTTFSTRKKTVFAVIGGIVSIKAQDVFLEAITQLTKEELDKSEFWLIGNCQPENQYGNSILKQVEMIPEVRWLGELNRKEIEKVYKDIDVVVVPSRQETMSIVMTEAFMYGKIGIASNVIGIAKYIKDKENGLIFESENVKDLAGKMSWVLKNQDKLNSMSVKARKTFERFFTLKVFGERLEMIINTKMVSPMSNLPL